VEKTIVVQRAIASRRMLCAVLATVVASVVGSVRGDIVGTGDVVPTNPATWTSVTKGYVGNTSDGSVTVDANNKLETLIGYVGYAAGANGTVNVVGTGSTWTNVYNAMYVGYSGNGTIHVTEGGIISWNFSDLGLNAGATGMVTVDGAGSKWTNNSYLTIGNSGTGMLAITNGGNVSSNSGSLGLNAGATGMVTVDGAGSMWTNTWNLNVGSFGTGTLAITHGGNVSSNSGNLGMNAGATGMVTVDGAGSMWTNSDSLIVGYSGAGTLALANGGAVTVTGATLIASGSTGMGTIDFGSNGGPLTTASLFALPAHFTGTGMINTRGLVSDGALVFDAAHGLTRTLVWSGANENVTVHLDLTGASGAVGAIGAGYQGAGSLTIQDVAVASNGGFLGYKAGATGLASVDGTSSTWTNSGSLTVGKYGAGTLAITKGGQVSDTFGYLGMNAGATGMVAVDGAGSTWTSASDVYVGNAGTGMLAITNGGLVTVGGATCVANGSASTGTINFGSNGGTLTTKTLFAVPLQVVGTGTINTCGLVSDGELVFDAGHGLNQTLTWDEANEKVTVHLDLTGVGGAVGALGAGYQGTGSLTIQGGVSVSSNGGFVGYKAGAVGIAVVSGSGATWTNSGGLIIGNSGAGTLTITNGGKVSNSSAISA
jgi:T5SS/PEP-CTERM-associated repeat protein